MTTKNDVVNAARELVKHWGGMEKLKLFPQMIKPCQDLIKAVDAFDKERAEQEPK